ncbi:MAG: TolC family protein [Kofleriaceae bacterium]
MHRLSLVAPLVLVALALATPAAADPVTVAVRIVGDTGGSPVPPLLGALTGPAEAVDLPALLDRALRSAPALASARVDLAVDQAVIEQARAWDAWGVGADLDASTRSGGGFVQRTRAVALSGDLTRRLSTGGTAGLHAETGWQDSTTQLGTTAAYSGAITASLTQPLLRGRGEALVRAATRSAEVARDADALALDGAAVAVVEATVLAYFDLIAAERELTIRRASLGLAQERLRVTQAGISAGGVAPAERISVDQAIATREEDILAAEVAVVERSLALRRAAAMPIGPGQLLLTATAELDVRPGSWDPAATIEQAVAFSPELARLRALEAGATIDVEVTERGILPALDLSVSLGPSGTSDGPGQAALNLITFDDFTAALGLSYRTSLGEVAAKATARASRARRERVRVTSDDVTRQIRQAVAEALVAITAAERRHQLAQRTIALAEQSLAAEQARLQSGRSRNVDVLQRQDELRAAQLREINATVAWNRAVATLAALTGELLPRYGVALTPAR